ncbi:MAG: hypothetical protein H5U07_11210 [Candidatus Aminicenantes bacterium]|nr:hypothetical protein [Candidatus Aminicenantes bacterium]
MTSWKKGVISFVLVLGLIILGSTVFAQQEQQKAQTTTKDFEGTVKVALAKYIYMPETKGLDIILAGDVEGGVESLVGKEVRVKASVLPDKPNLLLAESLEIKEGDSYRQVYNRSVEPDFSDYFDQHTRDDYLALDISDLKKPESWKGETKVKVYGKLEDSHVVILDKNGKEVAKVVVDNISDYAKFYMKKLRLFDKFWFYLNVKEQMDRRTIARKKEIMKADVVFCGLF